MELRHFRYFVAVAEESSLGRAAHRLHVSQPALSQQISDLENELGLKLFTRNWRGVELTEAGRAFLVGGCRVLIAAGQAAEQAREAANGERGRLVIGGLNGATLSFLPSVLSRFRDQYPLVELTPLRMNNREQVEAVLNGSIMIGIGFYSYALEEDEREQVSTRLLLRSPAILVCPRNRRLPKGRVPELKDFGHEKFLYLAQDFAFGYQQWLREFCGRRGGFEPDIAPLADSGDSLIGMVAAGRGVFVGPEVSIRARLEAWRSAGDIYLLTGPESDCELLAIWKKQSHVEQIISQFVEVMVTELESGSTAIGIACAL